MNSRRLEPILLIAFSGILVAVNSQIGCSKSSVPRKSEIVSSLEKCPGWTEIGHGDKQAKNSVIKYLERISNNDITDIRSGVTNYLGDNRSAPNSFLGKSSKIYLLNRYLFNVPEFAQPEEPVFGAWRNPIQNGKVNVLWPFSLLANGKLELDGVFSGYTGEAYDAIGEFDYFLTTYGRRKIDASAKRGFQPGVACTCC